jgi:curli biogenesis system outer membrane secretion channel CsgG
MKKNAVLCVLALLLLPLAGYAKEPAAPLKSPTAATAQNTDEGPDEGPGKPAPVCPGKCELGACAGPNEIEQGQGEQGGCVRDLKCCVVVTPRDVSEPKPESPKKTKGY